MMRSTGLPIEKPLCQLSTEDVEQDDGAYGGKEAKGKRRESQRFCEGRERKYKGEQYDEDGGEQEVFAGTVFIKGL